jgi:biotin carboxyl carrier protein
MENGMSRLDFTDPASLEALTEMLTAAGVEGLEISTPNAQLRLVISVPETVRTSSSTVTFKPTSTTSGATVNAPIAGHFHLSHPSLASEAGQFPRSVVASDVIGFIRIGQILVPVLAGRTGLLTRQLAEQNALVGFGDVLFELEPQS